MFGDCGGRIRGARDLTDDLPGTAVLDEAADQVAEKRAVIDDEDAHA
jgi:hypothetical protein